MHRLCFLACVGLLGMGGAELRAQSCTTGVDIPISARLGGETELMNSVLFFCTALTQSAVTVDVAFTDLLSGAAIPITSGVGEANLLVETEWFSSQYTGVVQGNRVLFSGVDFPEALFRTRHCIPRWLVT